jgi:hypothetical protein
MNSPIMNVLPSNRCNTINSLGYFVRLESASAGFLFGGVGLAQAKSQCQTTLTFVSPVGICNVT